MDQTKVQGLLDRLTTDFNKLMVGPYFDEMREFVDDSPNNRIMIAIAQAALASASLDYLKQNGVADPMEAIQVAVSLTGHSMQSWLMGVLKQNNLELDGLNGIAAVPQKLN
ncbi:MAG TPA: hypothetical protein VFR24_27510 [Candidatus Angelobacter sp.]|nr:hypothetical protein [Candidatus Angelobacter sp.]